MKIVQGLPDKAQKISFAAQDSSLISGLTHNYYRYPARFSPGFAKTIINEYTSPNDLVIDPFMGGGTTLVECLASGRNSIGFDINQLAHFVSEVKTTLLSRNDIDALRAWRLLLEDSLYMNGDAQNFSISLDDALFKNLGSKDTWRLKKIIKQGLVSTESLANKKQNNFSRCVLLKAGQWALDGKRMLPSVAELRNKIYQYFDEMIDENILLKEVVEKNCKKPSKAYCINSSAININSCKVLNKYPKPKLILTSPPYPGVHILYHRWQIRGRKETPFPYAIAGKTDGSGHAYYSLGSRRESELTTYFESIENIFSNVREVCSQETMIVQLISFNDASWQLPKYLEVMKQAGCYETNPEGRSLQGGRIWRNVPNRKWYHRTSQNKTNSQEVVLFHKLKR